MDLTGQLYIIIAYCCYGEKLSDGRERGRGGEGWREKDGWSEREGGGWGRRRRPMRQRRKGKKRRRRTLAFSLAQIKTDGRTTFVKEPREKTLFRSVLNIIFETFNFV